MSKGVNKVLLIGNLGKDPEVRYTQAGKAVANFSLATGRKVKRGDQWEEETEWHNVVLWERLAEVAKEYARKGSRVYVEGRLQTRPWEDKDGNKRYTTEVIGFDFQLLDSKSENGAAHDSPAEMAPQQADNPNPDDVPF